MGDAAEHGPSGRQARLYLPPCGQVAPAAFVSSPTRHRVGMNRRFGGGDGAIASITRSG
jgi:hypothetical protein